MVGLTPFSTGRILSIVVVASSTNKQTSHKELLMLFQVFKFVLDLMYDAVLAYGMLYIISQVMSTVKYFIQTQHEQRMAQLNNEFYQENDRLLR
jgi:hypothetical protein